MPSIVANCPGVIFACPWDKLEAKDWVDRKTKPDDNRVQWLSLASQGSHLLPTLAELANRNEEHFFGCPWRIDIVAGKSGFVTHVTFFGHFRCP
jgi:hypothetical protein